MRTTFAILVLVPILAATAVLVGLAAGEHVESLGIGDRPRNVAEAAALGDAADVIRLIRAGQDPRRVYPVRASVISSSVRSATGLEAAMWSREPAMIRLLDAQGFIDDPGVRRRLACLAADLDSRDVAAYLSRGDATPCAHGEAYADVLAR